MFSRTVGVCAYTVYTALVIAVPSALIGTLFMLGGLTIPSKLMLGLATASAATGLVAFLALIIIALLAEG